MPKVQGRLLIVDDEEDIREVLKASLENFVEHISEAQDGAEAIEMMTHQSFDAVLSDINMPRKNGIEFLKWIRSHVIDIPFVILTGHGDSVMADRLKPLGVDCFLTKPWDRKKIIEVIQKAVRDGVEKNQKAADTAS